MKFKAKAYYNQQKHRALAIPDDKTLESLSEETLRWIGPEVTEKAIDLDTSERLIGFNPQKVWDDFQEKGFSTFEVKATISIVEG